MITCPWCGTNYIEFQPNCQNCGGTLPLPAPAYSAQERTLNAPLLTPPPAPRRVPQDYAWRSLLADGAAIAALVLLSLGATFSIVGLGLSLGVVTALIGFPFLILGLFLLVVGGGILALRWDAVQKKMDVLRRGAPALGKITALRENYHVRINGRYPWTIEYSFQMLGQDFAGKVITLVRPDLDQRPGRPVYVLYLPDQPQHNTIYPAL